MDSSKFKQIGTIAAIVYFSQGALGISGVALPLYLRAQGWSISEITVLSSLVAFPWVFKILYGLISDNFPLWGSRRKSYLIICQLIAILGWCGIALAPPEKTLIFIWLVFANLGFATTDVVTDGLIVENSDEKTSSIFQSIAWGSRSLGAIVSGVIGGWLATRWSAGHIFLLTAGLPVVVLLVVLKIDEHAPNSGNKLSILGSLQACFKMVMTSNLKWFMCFLLLMGVPASFTTPFFFYMKEDLNFQETFLGLLMSIGWTGALIGSFVYAKWLKNFSMRTILQFAIVISVLNILSTLLIQNVTTAAILVSLGGILGCLAILPMMSSAAYLTSKSGVEGTMFAVLMSIYNLSQMGFGYLGGKLYPHLGLKGLIIGSSILISFGIFAARKLDFAHAVEVSQ